MKRLRPWAAQWRNALPCLSSFLGLLVLRIAYHYFAHSIWDDFALGRPSGSSLQLGLLLLRIAHHWFAHSIYELLGLWMGGDPIFSPAQRSGRPGGRASPTQPSPVKPSPVVESFFVTSVDRKRRNLVKYNSFLTFWASGRRSETTRKHWYVVWLPAKHIMSIEKHIIFH